MFAIKYRAGYIRFVASALVVMPLAFLLAGCSEPEAPGVPVPMIFVNDNFYMSTHGDARYLFDDSFTHIGEIESFTRNLMESPENFQANVNMVGAKLYLSEDALVVIVVEGEFYTAYRLYEPTNE